MRRVELNGVTLLTLTDVAPPPADWTYAFAAHADEQDAPARRRWAPDGQFHTRFAVHAFVHGGRVTIVDAGLGPDSNPYFNGLRGHLAAELAAAGIAPDQVDCVMFTHFHLDHVGWASRDGEPFFRNARYVAPAAELAHWQAQGADAALPHHVAAFERHVAPLIAKGLLQGLGPDEPAPSAMPLRYLALPGHTPGHAAVLFETDIAKAAVAGDSWHSPAQIERPDWGHRADRDRQAAVGSRIKLAQWAQVNRALVAAGHFPEDQGIGRIAGAADGGLVWEPLD
jgi:glyoxylase-like metal-dependent hydrolase (beta-lactamase superfamily II)